jgi:catechol 2,3-dioxygenase-like lactoylglutathione lyase family enzyme
MKLDYITLMVEDMAKSREFYRDKLGLPVKEDHGLDWCSFETGGTTLALHPAREGGAKPHHRFELFFSVDDIDREYEQLKAKGVKFTDKPVDQPYGWRTAHCTDPEGNVIEIGSPVKR